MKSHYVFLIVALLASQPAASNCFDCSNTRVSISGSTGVAFYNDAYARDGQSILGRLSLELQREFSESLSLGLEVGMQNGNTMRLDIPKPVLNTLGGEPVSVVVKPLLDALATLKITPFDNPGLFGFVKGGIAFRQLQVDRNEVNDLVRLNPELQAGLGYGLSDNGAFFVGYQHVFGKNPNYQVNPLTETGHIENLPSQHSILLGFSILF
ncbi:TPA: hypothetical protein ACT9K7_001839 [Legionella pneumophila]|uniref:hypothetical protein n=1 Tax=Legionella TaxID=445 RepID=UPI00034BEFF6|nr:hypothetical protein [Legionella anisa]HAU0230588.1 hypothetical protein [Legionella pneumophila]